MASDKIKILIDKYFEAETTSVEEKELSAYFKSGDVSQELESYKPLFQYLNEAKKEQFTGSVPLKPRKFNYRWLSVAAVAVLAFGIYFGKNYQEQREAEFAYNETKRALQLLAQNLDRGNQKVAYLNEFEKTKQKIYKHN
ncbi:MAG: hypothetical protein OER83_05080 [Flavobacteriaceae bacterium]|nr:hypothetical protein [Flavobacteriaceae bacterium]MDH3796225.1 hypothetical protein [Flavobacteriaceae bacterium]